MIVYLCWGAFEKKDVLMKIWLSGRGKNKIAIDKFEVQLYNEGQL
jgi:hypothetical protein